MQNAVSSGQGAPSARPTGWRLWGPRRRRFAALTVAAWLATAVVFTIGLALQNFWVAVAVVPTLALEWWLSAKWRAAEVAEGALGHIAVGRGHEERERQRASAPNEDEEDALLDDEWLDDDSGLYPSRESLLLRSGSEVVAVLGIGLVLVGFPSVWLAAPGGLLWVIGGDRGARVVRGLLDERLHRTPVSDDTRDRWLRVEERAGLAFYTLAAMALAALTLL